MSSQKQTILAKWNKQLELYQNDYNELKTIQKNNGTNGEIEIQLFNYLLIISNIKFFIEDLDTIMT